MIALLCLLLVATTNIIHTSAKALDKGLSVLQPESIAGDIPHTEASFGTPQYGASITGRLNYEAGN